MSTISIPEPSPSISLSRSCLSMISCFHFPHDPSSQPLPEMTNVNTYSVEPDPNNAQIYFLNTLTDVAESSFLGFNLSLSLLPLHVLFPLLTASFDISLPSCSRTYQKILASSGLHPFFHDNLENNVGAKATLLPPYPSWLRVFHPRQTGHEAIKEVLIGAMMKELPSWKRR